MMMGNDFAARSETADVKHENGYCLNKSVKCFGSRRTEDVGET